MNIRGERECRDCGSRWSYYETGSVECPDCGSLKSVGTAERALHTDAPATLELSRHRARFGEARSTLPAEGVDELKRDLREYVRKRGFVRGGELRWLDSTYLAARELLEAVDVYDRLRDPTDADREYLLALLAGADDGERPESSAVPESMREARGMAAARAVDEYREDLTAFLDELERRGSENAESERAEPKRDEDAVGDTVTVDAGPTATDSVVNPVDRVAPARAVLERLRDRTKRVDALNGEVDPGTADALIEAADALGDYVRTGNVASLDRARDRIDESES
ncbi:MULTISPECIES: DUF7117 family protein [Haloferacaceae]|uniref:TFIIB-type zinc ribbon-containing protein n=1 Tax=Halorubrum glutamatedens TaxID=2707018 RepID=A0ABD5QS64_9EURY|nr:hypothetical protein [Halobellus captivus]